MKEIKDGNKTLHVFRIDNAMYSYYDPEGWTIEDFEEMIEEYPKTGYQGIGISFDIETTSFEYNDDHIGTMYHWQIGIGRKTICGRFWHQCVNIFNLLNEAAKRLKLTLLVWVQNFSFEWQWIKGHFTWNDITRKDKRTKEKYIVKDIFAKSDREVLMAKTGNIEFRCSLALTDCGLAKFQQNYNLSIGKLKGDLDYDLIRISDANGNYSTPMTPKEIAYCINDVQVLTEWHEKYIVPTFFAAGIKVPLTSTGIVRLDMKNAFNELSKEEKKKYRRMIRTAMPSEEMYEVFRRNLFRGGLVHANASYCNSTLSFEKEHDAAGFDLKSAHPGAALQEKYPYKFYRMNAENWKLILEECRSGDFAFFGCFKFKNIRAKGWHSLESKNKLVDYSEGCFFENGRLAYSGKDGWIEVVLTEIDFFNYEKMYEWEGDPECYYIYEAEKKPLPDFMRKTFLKYFELKETIDKEKDPVNYGMVKRKLNGIFGMAATSIISEELEYNPETKEFVPSVHVKDYDDLTHGLLLLPQWSIWIAAYSREKICDALSNIGVDAIYYDTDSVKLIHYPEHSAYFEEYNKKCMEKNAKMEVYDYDPKLFERICCFEHEYWIDNMKVLGAKRYIVAHDGKTEVVVAGMVKGSLEAYCKENGIDIWDYFSDGLRLPADSSRKTTTSYTDEPVTAIVTDYTGETHTIHEESCVSIFKIPFEMNVEKAFIERIQQKMEERKHHQYKGVL